MSTTLFLFVILVWFALRHRNKQRHRNEIDHMSITNAVDMYSVLLLSGLSLQQSLQQLHLYTEGQLRIMLSDSSVLLTNGARFADVVSQLRATLGSHAFSFCESLLNAERDGLPITTMLERLSTISRQQRRQHLESEARKLPIRMTLPLVSCVLPSFILLGITPLFVGSLSSLGAHM